MLAQNFAKILNGVQRLSRRIPQAPLKYVHATRLLPAKLYLDRENKFAHDILEQTPNLTNIFRVANVTNGSKTQTEVPAVVLDEAATSAMKPEDVFHNFRAIVSYCAGTNTCISDERFRPFTQHFCSVVHEFTDEQLVEALTQLVLLPTAASVKVQNYVEIWNVLDVECCRRLDNWKSDQLLMVSDIWFALNLARISDFVDEALRKLSRKVSKMTPSQLVHTMFLCNVLRRPVLDMFEFEANLATCVDRLTLPELGVMAMGFFKTQTPIHNPKLLEQLFQRLMQELDTVEDITLVAILKILRYSCKIPQADLILKLQDALYAQVDRLTLLSCLHVALLGTDLQCCHDKIVEMVVKRFATELETARLKDLERICFAIGLFNFHSPSGIEDKLCESVLKLLPTRIPEIIRHPRCFSRCLYFLTLRGFHDPEMISSVLDKNFIHHTYNKNLGLARELFFLDSYVKINLKDTNYEGHQLPDKYRRTMGKLLTHYIPERNSKFRLSTTDRILLEIKETTDRIFRVNTFKHILPHFERPDIVVCYDRKQRKPIPTSEECAHDYGGAILTRKELLGSQEAAEYIDTLAIVVGGWNNLIRGKNQPTGLFNMKLEQLKILGHKYIVIYWHEWRELETPQDRQNFIRRRLSTVINL